MNNSGQRHSTVAKIMREMGKTRKSPMSEATPAKERHLTSVAAPTPGPSDYSPVIPPNGPFYSIQNRNHPPQRDDVDRPLFYDSGDKNEIIFESTPKFSFRQKLPEKHLEFTPGPLDYDPPSLVGSEARTAVHYAHKTIQTVTRVDGPGPNKYALPSTLNGPQFSLSGRLETPVEIKPGPLDYPNAMHRPSERKAPAYSLSSRNARDHMLTKETENTPASNMYYPRLSWNERGVTLKGKKTSVNTLLTWVNQAEFVKSISTLSQISASIKFDNTPSNEEIIRSVPPPTKYTPKFAFVNSTMPSFTLGKRLETIVSDDITPGPGAYEPDHKSSKHSINIVLKGRHKTNMEKLPGPADYDCIPNLTRVTISKQDLLRMAFRKAYGKDLNGFKEKLENTQTSPGPFDYTLPPLNSANKGFSLGSRRKELKVPQTPAPNAYNIDSADRNKGQGVTLKGRPSSHMVIFPVDVTQKAND